MQGNSGNAIDNFYEYCSKFSKLVIYGAGDVGRLVAEFMEEERIPVSCFCVTAAPDKRKLGNYEVKEIDQVLRSKTSTGIIVAVSRKNVKEILCLLERREASCFYSPDFLFELFRKRCERSASKVEVREGYLCRVSHMAFEKSTFYISCPASIGDTLYVAALVKAFKKENPSVQKVCLILKEAHRELGGLFPAVDEVLVSNEMVEILDQYALYTQVWRLNNYIYGHFKKTIHFEYYEEYVKEAGRTMLPRYGRLILNLRQEAELEPAVWDREGISPLPRKKQVVLMPYARTAAMLPGDFWEEIALRLKKRGYAVYTNVGSEKEKPLRGTEAVQKSLVQTARFCENCAAVISLRSGLCDLLGFANTPLIVVNTSRELWEEWNLKDMFSRDGIYNINCFDSVNQKESLEKIMKLVG